MFITFEYLYTAVKIIRYAPLRPCSWALQSRRPTGATTADTRDEMRTQNGETKEKL